MDNAVALPVDAGRQQHAAAYYALFISSAMVLLFQSYELTFGYWALVALISARRTYDIRFLRLVAIPIVILLLAVFSALWQQPVLYNYLRDVAYLLKPVLGMTIGYNFCKILGVRIFRAIVYAAAALATFHICILGINYVFFAIRDVNQLRDIGGYFDDLEVYALIILIYRSKFHIGFSKYKAYMLLLIIGFSSFLYLARTNIIQFFILFFAMKGYLILTRRSLKVLSLIILGVLASYAAIYYANPRRQGKGIEAFLYKIKIAPIEPFKTHINKDDWKDFNDNYRSFENIITVRQVRHEGTFATIFGLGLGSTIDLGRYVYSNDHEYIRHIPTLHNAYMTIFLKAGIVGVLLTLYFIYLLSKRRKADNEDIRNMNYILVGSAFYLVLSNWVFMGLYLKLDNKSLVVGALVCYSEMLWKKYYPSLKNA